MNYDGEHKSGLYRWERQAKPKVYSRSQRVATNDDISDWIKKVEDASVKATDAAFGLATKGREKGRAVAQMRTRTVRDQEEAHAEAQDLLNQWINDKVHFDEDDGLDDLEAWRRARKVKQEGKGRDLTNSNNSDDVDEEAFLKWPTSGGLDSSWEVDEAAIYQRVKRSAVGDEDPYAGLLEMDEKDAVSSVLQSMLNKEVIKETFKRDIQDEDDKAVPDPRTRMEVRHRMVKENREKRQKEERKRLADRQMKKEARLDAQQIILKEQKAKEDKTKKEEAEIKKEMTKLRKELAEENRTKEDRLRREREEKEVMARLAMEELERQRKEEEEQLLLSHRSESAKKKKQMIRQEMWRTKQENKRLRTLHRHFTAWYDLVLSRRLLMGKVKAMCDWKVTVRAWCAWKSYARGQRAQLEAVNHQRQVIEGQRKGLTADRHYASRLLRRCMEGWTAWVSEETEKRALEQEREKTKSKMMALLDAVARGKDNNDKDACGEGGERKTSVDDAKDGRFSERSSKGEKPNGDPGLATPGRPDKPIQAWMEGTGSNHPQQDNRHHHHHHRHHHRHNQPQQQQLRPHSSASSAPSSPSSSPSQGAGQVGSKRPLRHPTDGWQVNRRHAHMDAEDIRHLGHPPDADDDDDDQQSETDASGYTDVEIRRRFGTQPWMNRHYVVNNYQHRYDAQQKALREQQQQIKEQRHMIEELRFQQSRQQLQQQAKGQRAQVGATDMSRIIEVPSQGRQIPREVEDLETVDEQGMMPLVVEESSTTTTNMNANKMNTDNHHQTSKTSAMPNDNVSVVSHQGQDTDRSSLLTGRSKSASSTVSTPQANTKYLQVLQNMEERAAQRARLKAEREDKRRRQEEEKLAELEKQEAERLQQIEEEKRARIDAYRQKKRMEKQKEGDRQKEAARQQELTQLAEQHYRRSLLKYRCLLPLKKLVGMSKRHWSRAVKHHNREVLRQSLMDWKRFSDAEISRKQAMADRMFEFLLVKHSFQRLKKYKYHSEFLLKRADRHFCASLKVRCFQRWTAFVHVERETSVRNEETARQHYLEYLLRSSFMAWRYLPEQQKREEERRKRKSELRQRVAALIPDFEPCASQDLTDQ